MKRFLLAVVGLPLTLCAMKPVALDVVARQKAGAAVVEIEYTVRDEDDQRVYVSLEASSDNGIMWDIPVRAVSGDTGLVEPGKGKKIIWEAGKDWPNQYSTGFRIKVNVRDKFCPMAGDDGMVYIPPVTYVQNGKETQLKAFCIDKWEFPNVVGAKPTVQISWEAAGDSCRKLNKRLCTELQWETACQGRYQYVFPYGREYQSARCNTESETLSVIGGNTPCVSSFGVYDLTGNVYEWTLDAYGVSTSEELAASGKPLKRTMRGGNYYLGRAASTCYSRAWEFPENRSRQLGFRCCYPILGE